MNSIKHFSTSRKGKSQLNGLGYLTAALICIIHIVPTMTMVLKQIGIYCYNWQCL